MEYYVRTSWGNTWELGEQIGNISFNISRSLVGTDWEEDIGNHMEHIGNFRIFKNKTKKKPFQVGWGGEGGWILLEGGGGDICVRLMCHQFAHMILVTLVYYYYYYYYYLWKLLKFSPQKFLFFFFFKQQKFVKEKNREIFLANLIIIWFFNMMESSKIN